MISNKAKQMSSHGHVKKSNNLGSNGERRFYDSCKNAKLNIFKSSVDQNMAHVDFIVNNMTFDVKGLKDSHKQGKIILELKNVQGAQGWCNAKGTPEWLAFDFGAFFVCVKNTDLYTCVKKLCNLKETTSKAKDCLYKAYSRTDRKDLLTMITLQDALNNCEHWFLPYGEYFEPMELL